MQKMMPQWTMGVLCVLTVGWAAACPVRAQPSAGMVLQLPRTAWLTTDTLWFSALLPDSPGARVLHAELATAAGQVLLRRHLPVSDGPVVPGAFALSDTLPEGGYQIRVFNGARYAARFVWLFSANGAEPAAVVAGLASPRGAETAAPAGLRVEVPPTVGTRGEIEVKWRDLSGAPVRGTFVVSVVRDVGPVPLLPEAVQTFPAVDTNRWQVSGRVLRAGQATSIGRVTLSRPGLNPDYEVTFTRPDGSFAFVQTPEGELAPDASRKAIVRAVGSGDDDVRLVLDGDELRYPGPAALAPVPADTAGLAHWLHLTRRRHRLHRQFQPPDTATATNDYRRRRPYSQFGRTIPTDDLPPLADGAEFIKEVIMEVRIDRKNRPGERKLRMLNPSTKLYFREQPLMLIDGIPTEDVEELLNLPGDEIVAVELTMAPYSQYDFGFEGRNGMIAIYTRQGNYRPTRPSVRVLDDPGLRSPPAYEVPALPAPTVPDLREVVYWQPAARDAVRFRHSDETGRFRVRVVGVDERGQVVAGEAVYVTQLP